MKNIFIFVADKLKHMELTDKALKAIADSHRILYSIAGELEVHISTVNRWVKSNNDNLTKAAVLDIISKETGIEKSKLLKQN